jgi:uroporphyrinogen decarboxylase
MTRTERVAAAVNGDEVDRIPVCFWHHFSPGGSGRAMADATIHFFDQEFDLDIAKVMPDIPYPFPQRSIQQPNDWRLFEPIDPAQSRFFRERAESVALIRDVLGMETPVIMTVFSPLAEAMYAARDRELFLAHLEEQPALIHEVLSTIALNLNNHIRDIIAAGADGIFFSVQGITSVLHVHGEKNLMFDLILDYPVQVLSWSDRLAGPSLREVRVKTSKALMGGWNEFGPLSQGPIEQIQAEALDAIAQTGGRKFILANGCSVPDDTDHGILEAARDIAQNLRPPV